MKSSFIVLTLLLCIIFGVIAATIGILVLQPIFGKGLGVGLQFILAFISGMYSTTLAHRILGDD